MVLNILFIYIHILYTAQRLRVVEIHVKRNIVGSTLCFHFRNVIDNFIFIRVQSSIEFNFNALYKNLLLN